MSTADDGTRPVLPLCFAMLWIAGLPTFVLALHPLFASVPVLKPDRVTFLLAAAPLAIAAVRRPGSVQPPGRLEAAMALYLGLIVVSWVTTFPSKDSATIKADADFLLTSFVMPFTAFLIARNLSWTERRMAIGLWILVGGVATYLLLYGAVQYTVDWGALVPTELKEAHPDRAQGPFENAVLYGVVLSLFLPLVLLLFLHTSTLWIRLVLVAIALGVLQSIVGSKTRSVWLALPIAMLIPILRYPRGRLLAAAIVALLAAQVLLVPRLGLDFWGLRTRLTQVNQIHDRVAVTATATNMIQHRPLFGFGVGMFTFNADKASYYASWGAVSTKSAVYPNSPHNDLLNVVVMMGVIGLLAYAALLAAIVWLLWRRPAPGGPRTAFAADLAAAVQAIFLIVIVNGLFHSVMHMAYVQTLLFFLLGMVAHTPAVGVRGH